jgi:hypothetical protein
MKGLSLKRALLVVWTCSRSELTLGEHDEHLLESELICARNDSTWMHAICPVFQFNHAGAGQSLELRTLFHRLAAILAIPIHVFFVFDGGHRPTTKWGKKVKWKIHWLTHTFQELLDAFGFGWYEVHS